MDIEPSGGSRFNAASTLAVTASSGRSATATEVARAAFADGLETDALIRELLASCGCRPAD
jgi:hypothetical protein